MASQHYLLDTGGLRHADWIDSESLSLDRGESPVSPTLLLVELDILNFISICQAKRSDCSIQKARHIARLRGYQVNMAQVGLPQPSDFSQRDGTTMDPGAKRWSNFDQYPVTPPELDPLPDGGSPTYFPAADDQPVVETTSKPLVAVIGIGYVGTHLVNIFSRAYHVLGFDVSAKRVLELKHQYDSDGMTKFTSNPQDLIVATHFLISVPTLLRNDQSVDSSNLRDALRTVEVYGRRGSTVVIESSVAVGMTRQLLGPLATGRGFFAGMSPEVSIPIIGDHRPI
jgi:hypothetical protein